ncbi:MAG: hypothetical protein DDT21_01839 [Syntrophomonadaceae bacterium]|nr:hypothetical protein [Bacillota bacterium]
MIKLTATPKSRQDINELAAFLQSLNTPTPGMRKRLGDVVRGLFAFRFINEGSPSGQWASLKDRTRIERIREGYGAAHPILERSSDYRRSFTDLANADNYEMTILRPDGWTMKFGSSDWRVSELEGGRSDMEARPVTLLENSEEDDIGDALDRLFQQAADDLGMARGA